MNQPQSTKPRRLHLVLWFLQILAAAFFCYAAAMKIATPIPQLAALWPWTGEMPVLAVRGLGIIDLLGGIGLILPALTGIKPRLTVMAAGGCILLQLCAIIFHAARSEFLALPVNFITIGICIAIYWGRSRAEPFIAAKLRPNEDGHR